MAKKDDGSNKLLWIAGTALVTGGAFYVAQKFLKEQEELKEFKLRKQLEAERNPHMEDDD